MYILNFFAYQVVKMHVKFKRPSGLVFSIWFLLLVPLHCLPNIEHTQLSQSGNNAAELIDKSPFNQPELEDTIEEVQKILAQDPSLPRLTRGEIEELYEKVTREEYEKSLKAGDISRADSMRALMLVLPYNTDNTEENLQELYTRPPITKVIDGYTPPKPKNFATTESTRVTKNDSDQLAAATKDTLSKLKETDINPTPFHPPAPQKVYKKPISTINVESMTGFRPITTHAPVYNFALNAADVAKTIKPNQRFSSQYSAKNANFLRPIRPKTTSSRTTTIKAMADVLQNFGIVSQAQLRRNALHDDFIPAESAPQPVISTYVPQTINYGQLQKLYAQRPQPKITAEAYSNFKPLNIGEEIRVQPEIAGYLTRFGIVANRKMKELGKGKDEKETDNQDTELYETKVINGVKRARKGVENKTSGNSEIDKLLENLKELERLNVDPKMLKTTTITTTETPTIITTTTMRDIITNGAPMLIEPKKPVRRIDPNLDLNFGSASNKENDNMNQLEKLLENLEELQKLKINPENVLKAVVSTTPKPVQTTAAIRATNIINRLVSPQIQGQQTQQQQEKQEKFERQANAQELEEILKQIQAAEQKKPTTTTTTTTTKKPVMNRNASGLNGLSQLRRLLNNDSELERLYNDARERAVGKATTTTIRPTTTTTTTTTTTSTTTTKPQLPNLNVEELQKYLAFLDRPRTTTTTTTTAEPTTTTTTTTERSVKKATLANDQILELINRVQELERAQTQKQPLPNYSNMPFLGFTSRNVNSPYGLENNKVYRSSNDFAQLQQLYEKVQNVQTNSFGEVDISTAKSQAQENREKSQDFAQRIIDITNDTGSGSSLQQVEPNEFVHLQKLLKKVQELERVRIGPNGIVQTMSSTPTIKTQRQVAATPKSKLASVESEKVSVYAMPAKKPKESTSSEELREYIMATPANPAKTTLDADFEQYQEFFASLEEPERNAYKNNQPPVIQKSVTKEPPRFVETRKPQNLAKPTRPAKKDDLKELQKLLSNAQELEKLGVTLPTQLSKEIENKIGQAVNLNVKEGFKKLQIPAGNGKVKNTEVDHYLEKYGILNAKEDFTKISTVSNEITTNAKELADEDNIDLAFISLTTIKPSTPKEIKSTTVSSVQQHVFSATKIIEAAIKRAATKIGVSTENTLGFRKRSDMDIMDMHTDDNDDLLAEFSELNYQIASPDIITTEKPVGQNGTLDISQDLNELERLIRNLKELQALNISSSAQALRVADAAYLETFKNAQNNESLVTKSRRQSETSTVTSTSTTEEDSTSPTSPTRINFDLISLDDTDDSTNVTETSSTTEESRNGSLSDLEDSFGGPDPNAEAEQPAKKKNGFYFLADWNSFLEVGSEDQEDQVVVRLSPKIGDPRLFIPVKIP